MREDIPTSPGQPIASNTADDNVATVYTATLRDDKDMYSQSELTGLTGCGAYSSTSERWEIVDRPVTESVSAREWNDTNFPSYEHSDERALLECILCKIGLTD